MALSESSSQGGHRSQLPESATGVTDYFKNSVFLFNCCCVISQKKLFHVLSKPRCWFSGIISWYFTEPLFFKPVIIPVCFASQLPAPDWRFSHRWRPWDKDALLIKLWAPFITKNSQTNSTIKQIHQFETYHLTMLFSFRALPRKLLIDKPDLVTSRCSRFFLKFFQN
jgi:hypothetical protein